MRSIKLSQWAKNNNYTYTGAYELFKRGHIPNAYKLPSGSIMVKEDVIIKEERQIVIYCRVSSAEQKNNLDSQSKRIEQYCIARGYKIHKIYKEIGSGMNDNRKILNKLLDTGNNITLVIEHKDRLTRFGFNYLEKLFTLKNSEIEVINEVEDSEKDLMQDFVSIITSFCSRLYGLRRGNRKTEKIIEELNENNDY